MVRARLSLAGVLGGALLLASLVGGGSAWAASHTIEPGESIGPIKLGMKRSKVHDVYHHGHKTSFQEGAGTLTEKYSHGDIDVTYCCGKKGSARAFSIATRSPEWTTDKGIGVGDSTLALAGNYHVDCENDEYVCTLSGSTTRTTTSFFLDTNQTSIEGIEVYTTEFAPQP